MNTKFGFYRQEAETSRLLNISRSEVLLKIALIIALAVLLMPRLVHGAGFFKTGWWTDIQVTSQLPQYAAEGSTLVLAVSGGWYTDSAGRRVIQRFLDAAERCELKVILSLVRENSTPFGIPIEDFIATATAFKSHPALYGWYIGDEPERYKEGWQITRSYLSADPGYYRLLKSIDPLHPVMISFDMIYEPYEKYWERIRSFLDVTDIVGMHNYPFWSPPQHVEEFSGAAARMQYDRWKYAFDQTKLIRKAGFIATAQGFGYQTNAAIYRDPSYNEMRYQVFTAVVQGVDHVLFWYDAWSNARTKNIVNQIIGQIQHIGMEMNAGVTNSPEVNIRGADHDNLLFRYGKVGLRHAILAVNIADRKNARGRELSGVQFTLPSSIQTPQISVAFENRTLTTVAGTSFTDTFKPFEVHIYTFETTN